MLINKINQLVGRNGAIVVANIFFNIFIYYYRQDVLNYLADGILLVGHVTGFPDEFVILLVLHDRRRD